MTVILEGIKAVIKLMDIIIIMMRVMATTVITIIVIIIRAMATVVLTKIVIIKLILMTMLTHY